MGFKERLKELIEKKAITAYRVAKDTGISHQLIGKYLNDSLVPKQDRLIALAKYFGVSETWLRTGFGDISPLHENPKTKENLNILSDVPEVYGQIHNILGIEEDEESKEFIERLRKMFPKENAPSGEDIKLKPSPKKPSNTEDRLLAIIESQQRTIEILHKMLANQQAGK